MVRRFDLLAELAELAELARRSRPDPHHVVAGQLARLCDTVRVQDFDAVEVEQLRAAGVRVQAILTRLPTTDEAR
jgi:hypothetical protein